MKALSNTRERTKLFAFFAASFIIYEGAVVLSYKSWNTTEVAYLFHCVNYEMGFCSKFFVGELYSIISGNYTKQNVALYEAILTAVFFIGLAAILAQFVTKTPREHKNKSVLLALLTALGPSALSPFTASLGILDVYWVYLSLIALLCLSSPFTSPFAAIPCCAMIFVHNGAVLNYLPMIAILCVFIASCEKKTFKKLLVIAAAVLVTVSSAAAFMYFSANDYKNLTMTQEEFDELLKTRDVKYTVYYDYNMYGDIEEFRAIEGLEGLESFNPGAQRSIPEKLRAQVHHVFTLLSAGSYMPDRYIAFALTLPLIVGMYAFIIKMFKKRTTLIEGLSYIAMLIFYPVAVTAATLASSDGVRWLIHSFLCMLTFTLYILHRKKDEAWSEMSIILGVPGNVPLFVYLLFYSASVFIPYS